MYMGGRSCGRHHVLLRNLAEEIEKIHWNIWGDSILTDPPTLFANIPVLVNSYVRYKVANNQLLALVSFVFRDKILKHIHTH